MRRLVLPLGLAAMCFSPWCTQAQPAPSDVPSATRRLSDDVLTLDRAVTLAAQRSFVLSAARHRIEATTGALTQASLLRNPSFTALVEDTRRETRTSTATIDVPLELGGQRAARTRAAERTRELAEVDLANAAADVHATVTAAFFDVLVAQQRLALAKDSAELATRGADAVARRVAAGKVSPVDETRARVDQANAALDVGEAEAALDAARRTLASQWNDAEPMFASVDGDVERLMRVARPVDIAIELSPSVVSGRAEVARRRALLDVEKTKRIPDVVFTVGAKRDNDLGRTQAVIGLSVPLPLFDRNQGNVTEAARRADEADDEHHALRVRVRDDVQKASARLAMATRTAETLKTVVLPAADDALRAATRGFEAGKFDFFDVVDAQRTLLAARTRYLVALSTAIQAATAIDRLLSRSRIGTS